MKESDRPGVLWSRRRLLLEVLERRDLLTAVRVVNWNTLDRPNNQTQINQFTTILSAIGSENVGGTARPIDLLALQETSPQRANNVEAILDGLYADDYESVTIGGGAPDEYVGFVYNTNVLELLATSSVSGSFTHEPMRGLFRPVGTSGDADFYAYSIHLKAGNSNSDEDKRTIETAALRNNADSLGNGAQVMFMGDFNMRSSNETAFDSFVAAGNAQLFDPINRLGNWYNNFSFRDIHTQNPQNNASGGFMDDRFDLQLLSGEFFDGQGIDYTSGSYRAFGNNGTHNLNGPITSGSGASPAVLSALALASDHLPVVADYEFTAGISLAVNDVIVDESAGTATFTISADAMPTSPVTVQYATQSGTAISNSDFEAKSGVATIATTSTSTTVVVDIIDDTLQEPDESFFLNLSGASAGATIADNQGIATITANDAVSVTFGFDQDTISVPEGTSEVTVEFVLSGNAPEFDAFTYAIGIGDGFGGGGTGTPPQFVAVPTLINDVVTWSNFADLPTPQAATGNVNAPAGTGASATLPSTVLTMTIDVSQSVQGDTWILDANLVDASDISFEGTPFPVIGSTSTINIVAAAEVVDRHLFYDNSYFDGFQLGAGAADDDAIDESKVPLLPAGDAEFANYTGYSQGINGIIVDIENLVSTPVADDFYFAVGNDSDPGNWAELMVAPVIDVRSGEGTDGSDRVTLTWPSGTIVNQWLQINVLSDGPGSIVSVPDTFYFGNALGEVGAGDTRVNSTDAGSISANFTPIFPPQTESVQEPHDVNKDGRVDSTDLGFTSGQFTPIFPPGQELALISVPGAALGFESAAAFQSFETPTQSSSLLQVSPVQTSLQTSASALTNRERDEAVDLAIVTTPARKLVSFGKPRDIVSTAPNPSLVDVVLAESPATDSLSRLLGTIANRNSSNSMKHLD
tara:strand:+ start:66431 stop:69196 length:2766 start_codon:yes stop_codon:yes gene_type:complete